jgi:hypothetical protein
MADKTISALTASTTPLAGTEVLPIVQSNATVKVAVSNLTAGRPVSMSLANVTLDDAVTNTVSYPIVATHTSTGTTTAGFGVGIDFRQENSTYSNVTQVATIESICTAQPDIHNDFIIKTKYNNNLAERIRIKNGADLVVSNGNFVPATAGKGIDFSANTHATGMTSELLNWYEEGTWTPVVVPGAGTITTQTCSGQYTRIGRVVQVQFSIVVNNIGTASSISSISGLPFTSSNTDAQGSSATFEEGVTGLTWTFRINKANTTFYITRYDNNTTMANNYTWRGSVTYTV